MSDHEKGIVLLSPDSETAAAADSESRTNTDKTVPSPPHKSKARHSRPAGKRSKFFLAFFSYVGALAVLIVVSLTLFWFYLKDYQRALPVNHGERIAQAYREGDAALLRQYLPICQILCRTIRLWPITWGNMWIPPIFLFTKATAAKRIS